MGENEDGASATSATSATSAGLLSALRSIAATLLASARTRLELLSNEIEFGKLRAIDLMLAALAMASCFGIGIILAVVFLVVLFWEQRLVVLGVCALFFFVLGGVLLARVKRLSRRPERIFAASVAELEQDLHQLKAMIDHEPPAR
ncbi:hypothetical protein AGMMS50256_17730 [Betaproteobacteria bacterium]|nr:hypothetical protein AGMMS50256_17730 [Betaproteobacteria bacterium]